MSKKFIKNHINKSFISPISCEDFKNIHECVEAYIKEILLLGLRRQGGNFKQSSRVIRHSYIKIEEYTFKKSMELLMMPNWNSMKTNNFRLAELEYFVLNYSCKVRNILVHGNFYPSKISEYEFLYNR